MVDIGVVNIPTPSFNITGLLSSSWLYIFILAFIFIVSFIVIAMVMFRRTFNKTVVIFENVAGLGFQVSRRMKARTVSLGTGGVEVLKCLGGDYVTAYGKKQGLNAFWFARLEDGFLYNFVLADLDAKRATMDVKPVQTDVRMWYVAKDRMAKDTYGKTSFLEKYGPTIIMFFFLVAFIIGMWVVVGKLNEGLQINAETSKTNAEVAQTNKDVLVSLNNILNENPNSGLVSARLNQGVPVGG